MLECFYIWGYLWECKNNCYYKEVKGKRVKCYTQRCLCLKRTKVGNSKGSHLVA